MFTLNMELNNFRYSVGGSNFIWELTKKNIFYFTVIFWDNNWQIQSVDPHPKQNNKQRPILPKYYSMTEKIRPNLQQMEAVLITWGHFFERGYIGKFLNYELKTLGKK